MKNTRDEILEAFLKELKKTSSDKDNTHVLETWEKVNMFDEDNESLMPVFPPLDMKQKNIVEPKSNTDVTEEVITENIPQQSIILFPEKEENPISKREKSIINTVKNYSLSNLENAKKINEYKDIVENTNVYQGLDFEDLFGEKAELSDSFNESPEYQAKYNTKHFLTSNTATYRGMKRDPSLANLFDKVINYYIANDPESLFKWNVFKPYGGFELRQKYYGPAVISYLEKDPIKVFQNRIFNDIEFIKLGLLPKLWEDVIGVASKNNVNSFSGESEAALLLLHRGLFEYEQNFYKNRVMGKDANGNLTINVDYFSNPNRINAEKKRQKSILNQAI